MSAAALAAIVVFLALGLPLFIGILGIALVGGATTSSVPPLAQFAHIMGTLLDNPFFVAIPLFAHAGLVLSESRAPERLVALVRALVGWAPAGAVVVTILASSVFTALTGASGVTILALGGLLLPVLARERYPDRFNLGLVTTCGSLGLLFPPSLPVIIFALIATPIAPVAVDTLFVAGLVPGLVLIAALSFFGAWVGRNTREVARTPFELGKLLAALRAAIFEIPLPAILIGGIFGGVLTLVQAAAAVAFYVSFVEVVVHADLSLGRLFSVTTRAMTLVGAILIILMAALALTNLLNDLEVPLAILSAIRAHLTSPLAFLVALNLFLLVVGCLMDIYSAILVVVPLILPLALSFGIDPVHLAILFLVNLELGYSTPPVGMNLFIASLRFRRPVLELYSASIPFLVVLGICLVAITFVPWLSLAAVRWYEGTGVVTVRWAERELATGSSGTGTARWALREGPPGGEASDPDTWVDPGPAAPTVAARGLDLRFRRSANSAVHEFEFASDRESPSRIRFRFEAPIPELAELAGFEGPAHGVSLVLAGSDLANLSVEDAAWTDACRIAIHAVEGDRVTGTLRATALHFPLDPELPEEMIFDVALDFDVLARPDVVDLPATFPADAREREIPDVRLVYRAPSDPELPLDLTLERTRTRPWNIAAAWRSPGRALEDLDGFDGELSANLAIAFDDERSGARLPADRPEMLRSRVSIERADESGVRGKIRAVLRDTESGRIYDVEVLFDLPARSAKR